MATSVGLNPRPRAARAPEGCPGATLRSASAAWHALRVATRRGLDDYAKKRDFARTPEPSAEAPHAARANVFVVHRHDARRLHYDLRLQFDGVLRSWAVPKGFTYDSAEKRLAVQTEDHPLAYEDFEGTIPKGEYGAGPMAIFDRGTFALARGTDLAAEFAAGELKLLFYGRRLRGEWHLVQTKQDKGKAWLMFKSRDRYEGGDLDVLMRLDLGAAQPAAGEPPAPMRPALDCAPFSAPSWAFEMEFAGRRALARIDGETVTVRAGADDLAARLPDVTRALRGLRATRASLDVVLVAADAHERPSRPLLDERLAQPQARGVVAYAFDLLDFDDLDLTRLPLVDRKALLRAALPANPHVLFVDHVLGEGERFVAAVAAAGLPAVLAKRTDSVYAPGPQPSWRRIPVATDAAAQRVPVTAALEARPKRRARSARVKLSNLDKVFWPDCGTTKGQLLDYYEAVAETLLPYLHDRAVHMNRHPDGIAGKSFYQREAKDYVPDWFPTADLASESKERPVKHMVCQDRDALLYLVNLGTIDLHPWLSRVQTPDQPDWAVLDLDPKGAPFADVLRVARSIGKVLQSIGVRAAVKTSGKTGMHIHIPLRPGYTYDHSRMFCEGIARVVLREHKAIATIERNPGKRDGKLYIDFLQNRRGQTVVPPYAVRPVAGATVSTPLTWDELSRDLHPSMFTLHNVPARVLEMGDLYRLTLTDPQDLLPAIDKLQGLLGR
jgi:bifunctional non-homologous end joining protein LigD